MNSTVKIEKSVTSIICNGVKLNMSPRCNALLGLLIENPDRRYNIQNMADHFNCSYQSASVTISKIGKALLAADVSDWLGYTGRLSGSTYYWAGPRNG